MTRHLPRGAGLTWLMSIRPTVSWSHSFDTPYVLPIPLWMYVYGCAATLILTFALVALSSNKTTEVAGANAHRTPVKSSGHCLSQSGLQLLRTGAAGCLSVCILAGFLGTDPSQNIGMTLFWVVFLLGFAYASVFLGNLYALINPWRWVVEGAERLGLNLSTPRTRYPERLAYWPAFLCYMALLWIELFLGPRPSILAISLVLYSIVTFTGVVLVGKLGWFCRGDVFSIYFRLFGKLAPIEYSPAGEWNFWRAGLRAPLAGASNDRPNHISLVLFVLLMLSSTTYDGIHDTEFWTGLFWKTLLWLLEPLWGTDLGKAQSLLMHWYLVYRQVGLIIFPVLYLTAYLFVLWCAKVLSGSTIPLRDLALDFCYSLLPIAISYNVTHYITFFITEMHNLPIVISDPFGLGWDIFRVLGKPKPFVLPMSLVWHAEVGILLAGHSISVWLSHRIALRTFDTQRQILVSQFPLLVLMVAYTVIGLWILSLPLGTVNG